MPSRSHAKTGTPIPNCLFSKDDFPCYMVKKFKGMDGKESIFCSGNLLTKLITDLFEKPDK
jgi:hypothetical protein